jgi:hypothetical protein
MPESFLGDGLIFEELLPLAWHAGPLAAGSGLARMNADNIQLLGAEASLDEVRVHEALKDESPALLHELQRLEFKLNVLLRLTASLAVRNSALPPVRRVRLSSSGLEWIGEDAPPPGSTGTLSAYMNPALPEALKISCTVTGERFDGQERVAQLRFNGLNDTLVGLLEKLIFRHHRRLIAGARLAAN